MPRSPDSSRGGTALMTALVIDSIGAGLFLPLPLLFFTRVSDVPLGLLGVLMSAANIVPLPVPIWAGSLADRLGALPLVIGAQMAQSVGYFFYNHVRGPVGVFLVSCLVAIGMRCFWSSVFTVIADFADGSASSRTKDTWFAWANTARAAGLSAGGVVASAVMVDGTISVYRATAYASSAAFLIAGTALAAFVRTPKRKPAAESSEAGYRTMLKDRVFVGFTGINTVFATTSMMLALGLPVYVLTGLHGPRVLAPAVLLGNSVLLAVLAAPVVRRLAVHRRSRLLIAAGTLWAVWCFAFAALSPGLGTLLIPLLVAAALVFTAADLIHAPVSMAFATALSPISARGRYLAAFQYSFTLAGVVGPAFFTTLFAIQRSLPWLVLGLVNMLAAFAMLLLERRVPGAAQREATHPEVAVGVVG